MRWLFALAFLVHTSATSYAAPCCGVGAATPTMITGDDSAQVSASISHGAVIGDAPTKGIAVFRANEDDETTQTFRIDAAALVSDRWQIGGSLPIVRRHRNIPKLTDSAAGLGDVILSGGYEALPEWGYSVWKPRGFLFTQLTLPTGGSVYDETDASADPFALEARGRGFFNLGLGALFLKNWSGWDAYTSAEVHHAFTRSFGALKIAPTAGGSITIAGGYSPSVIPIRVGLSLTPLFEGPYQVTSTDGQKSRSSTQIVWNTSAQLAWMIHSTATLSATYTDQTLIGPASNASLSRTVAVMFQKRWER